VPDPEDYFAIDATNFSAEKPPNLSVLDIDLVGISYTSLLALSFFRQSTTSGGLIVMTSSGAGIYPTPVQPFYAAAKHGVTGLARSMGQRVETEGIRVCALVPGLVPTTIMPQEILDRTDRAIMTPISHIVAAINDMLESDRNATVCEASVDKLWYRDPPPFLDDAQRRVITEVSKGMGPDFKKVRVEKEGKVAAQKVQ
jgi:NAD(P)-dependent dehydrogenase (short-subunit alcohol dehydrogenase family)